MKREKFREIESEDELIALLRQHRLFRDDDVTFEDLAGDKMYVYSGDDFSVDIPMLENMEPSAILIEGDVEVDYLSISDVLGDFGVLCVTGDIRCKDFFCGTESTGLSIGGDLHIANLGYLECGNSVVQVNGNIHAKLFYISQCSVEVEGEEKVEFDESASDNELRSLGLEFEDGEADEALQAYFQGLDESD